MPRELGRIALKALSRDPAERYPDAPAFEHALRSFLAHAESLGLAEEGWRTFEGLQTPGKVPLEERYATFDSVLATFAQALRLWDENDQALSGQAAAAESYANEALDRGDLGLAATELSTLRKNPRADRTRLANLEEAVRTRAATRSRSRVAIAVVLLLLGVGYRLTEAWRRNADEASRVETARENLRQELLDAWREIAAGNDTVRARDFPGVDAFRESRASLAWAREVLRWRDGRWQDVFPQTARTPLPPAVEKTPCADLLA